MPRTYHSRNPLARTAPLRSVPLYRSVEHVLGPSPRVRAEAELRNAASALAAEIEVYAAERRALGDANRRPITTRRWWQAQALRTLNARRGFIRAARKRLAAAQAAVAALTPTDDYATPWLAMQAGIVAPIAPAPQRATA